MSEVETVEEVTIDEETTQPDEVPDEKSRLLQKYGIEPDFSNLDEDTAIKFLKRIEKAEGLTVQQKKQLKELQSKTSEPTTKYLTEADLERRDFLKANPELNDYTKELTDFQKKGLSLDEAKVLILNSDKARANREKLNSLGLSDGEASSKKSSYTMSDLDKLASNNPNEYARVRNEMDAGKIKLVR